MKKLFFIVLLVFAGGVLFNSCEKTTMDTNDYSSIVKPETKLKEEESSDLSDENIWVLNYLYESLVDQKEEFLLDFLNCQGAPEWSGAILKRGEQISIATVPTSKNNCITGVFKIYQPIDQDPIINYYSIKEIDAIMERNIELNDFEYIGVRGAIQGFILSSQKLGFPIDQEKIDWLRNNNREPDFRVRFFCLEEWDCSDGEVSTDTHWVDCDGDGYFESCCEGTEFVCCELVSIECWVEEIPRNFPSSGIGTSCGCEGDGVESDNDGTHGDGQNSYDAKSDVLTSWMSSLNIENDLFNLLYDCVYYLPAPFGGAESGVNLNCAKSVLMGQLAENLTESQLELINDPENSDLSDAISQFLIDDNGMSQEEKVELINKVLQLKDILNLSVEEMVWLLKCNNVINEIVELTSNDNINWNSSNFMISSNTAALLGEEGNFHLYDNVTCQKIGVVNTELEEENPQIPFSSGWLNCSSFNFIETFGGLLTAGVDDLSLAVTFNSGSGPTISTNFNIDVRVNQVNNGELVYTWDANRCATWAANAAAKFLSFRIAEAGGMSVLGMQEEFIMYMNMAMDGASEMNLSNSNYCDNIQASVLLGNNLSNRNSATYFDNFVNYVWNCLR